MKVNGKLIFSLSVLAAGIIFYIGWNIEYGAWTDIGIYSITIILVISGIFGTLLTLTEEKD